MTYAAKLWPALAVQVLLVSHLSAAEPAMLDLPPFDQIFLRSEGDDKPLEVYPLDLPNRRVPTPFPAGNLTVRLVKQPGQDYEVSWNKVKRILLYEQALMDQARALMAEERFDEAYDYLARLIQEYSRTEGLDLLVRQFLRRNALSLYQQGQLDRALAVAASLLERYPNDRGIPAILERVAGSIISQRLKQQDYAGARAVLDMLTSQFGEVANQAIETWQQRFEAAAAKRLDTANKYLADDNFTDANREVRRALAIWPDSLPAREVLREILRRHPQITVGVFDLASDQPTRRIDSWADLRVSRICQPSICQLVGFSAEGGVYESPHGKVVVEDTDRGRRLTFQFAPQPGGGVSGKSQASAHRLARQLLDVANPELPGYRSDYGTLCDSIQVDDQRSVHVDLNRTHVRPEGMLLSVTSGARNRTDALFEIVESDQDHVRLIAIGNQTENEPGIREIIEQRMPSDQFALTAMLRNEITVLDRIPPWRVAQLKAADGITVGRYRLPTIHVLVPNPKNPLLGRSEFRRALIYGIDRAGILKRVIVGDQQLSGFEVISGPLPPGASRSDPVRYGYNAQIEPRGYLPHSAVMLSLTAVATLEKAKAKARAKAAEASGQATQAENASPGNNQTTAETTDTDGGDATDPAAPEEDSTYSEPTIPTLILAHPNDPVIRTACDAIAENLREVGIPIELRSLTPENSEEVYDLRYAELAVWEPVVDVHTLFGPEGLFPASSVMRAALRDLQQAGNWNLVRQRLSEVHRIAHHELPVIPLWQTVNYYAYHSELAGVGDSLITLYQNLPRWRLVPKQDSR